MGGRLTLALLGAAAAALVWLATARYGPGTTPDSATYLSVAQSLADGRGLVSYTGGTLTAQPPLFPALVAVLVKLGLAPLSAARALHALAFGALAVLSQRLFRQITPRAWLAWLGVGFVVASPELVRTFGYAWSEPLFTVFATAALLQLARPGALDRPGALVALGLTAAAAALTRYVGVVLIGVVCLEALLAAGSLARRAGRAALLGLVSGTPLLAWMLRNQAAGGGWTGRRLPADAALEDNALDLLETVADFLHLDELGAAGVAVAGLAVLGVGAVGLRLGGVARAAVLFVWGYAALVVLGASLTVVATLYLRFGAPLWPALLVLAVAVAEALLRARPALTRPLAGLAVLGLVLLALRTGSAVERAMRHGAGGYAERSWQESELLTHLKYAGYGSPMVTNQPALLALYTPLRPMSAPRSHAWRAASVALDDTARLLARLEQAGELRLAWFDDYSLSYGFLLPEELAPDGISAKPERLCSDGTLFHLTLRPWSMP